jgi:hypothetical protein
MSESVASTKGSPVLSSNAFSLPAASLQVEASVPLAIPWNEWPAKRPPQLEPVVPQASQVFVGSGEA